MPARAVQELLSFPKATVPWPSAVSVGDIAHGRDPLFVAFGGSAALHTTLPSARS